MEKKKEYVERIPIMEWPELDRKMAIVTRMTRDPPLKQQQKGKIPESEEDMDTLYPSFKNSIKRNRNIPAG